MPCVFAECTYCSFKRCVAYVVFRLGYVVELSRYSNPNAVVYTVKLVSVLSR